MHSEFPSHQGKPQFSIQSYLQDKVYKAQKLNNSFLFHNSRMIALLNNGMLVYYSKCFKTPLNSALKINARPKSGVYFNNVLHSCVRIADQDVELIVKFKKSQQYHFDSELGSYVKEPRSSQFIIWIFKISVGNYFHNMGNVKVNESVNSLYSCKLANFEDRTNNTTQKQVQTEKTSIEQRMSLKKQKSQKQVKWLDIHSSKIIAELKKEANSLQENEKKLFVSDELLDINEENVDSNLQNIHIRKLSLSASYLSFQAKKKET